MAENNSAKPVVAPLSKQFMTAGPTLHYSYSNVHQCWGLSIAVYIGACFFWSRLLTGEDLAVRITDIFLPHLWNLGRFTVEPLSIFEYPWHIVVLGSLMGVLAATPVLTAQLLSFRYCIPMILSAMLVGKLGLFGVFMMVSCAAVACRPLRFRSRFISMALCMAPQMIYWTAFGGYQSADPLRWGWSYAPWVYAWLISLVMAGVILGAGHFNRYKPGLIWITSAAITAAMFGVFTWRIGFAELDYQLYVAGNNPEEAVEFYDHSLSNVLDDVIGDQNIRTYLAGRFYPTETILLRQKLKNEIQNMMVYGRWPQWLGKKLSESMRYQVKRRELLRQYDLFIDKWPRSKRMPVALYYKALLNEMQPDIRQFSRTETLHFYSDYPFYEHILIWYDLYDRFPQSPESLEARWRIAMHESGQGNFEKACQLCEVALGLLAEYSRSQGIVPQQPSGEEAAFLSAFAPPEHTIMTAGKLRDLYFRLKRLLALVAPANRGDTQASRQRLADFVMLNQYGTDYDAKLEAILADMKTDDPLQDNVQLARALLIPDSMLRSQKLSEITSAYAGADGGNQALYEFALLKVGIWKDPQAGPDARKAALSEARGILEGLIRNLPDSLWAEQAKTFLASLPTQIEN